jgi:hypothetical protein
VPGAASLAMLKRLDTKVNGTKISARYVNRETFIVSKNNRRLSNDHDEGSDDRGQSFQPATERVGFYSDVLVFTYQGSPDFRVWQISATRLYEVGEGGDLRRLLERHRQLCRWQR